MADARKGREFEPSEINGYRISWNGSYWQAVKKGIVAKKHSTRKSVVEWAHRH